MNLERMPDHPMEELCRSDESEPVPGRVVEEFLLNLYKGNENQAVRDAVEVSLYDLHSVMHLLLDLMETLHNDPNIDITFVTSSPVTYHS